MCYLLLSSLPQCYAHACTPAIMSPRPYPLPGGCLIQASELVAASSDFWCACFLCAVHEQKDETGLAVAAELLCRALHRPSSWQGSRVCVVATQHKAVHLCSQCSVTTPTATGCCRPNTMAAFPNKCCAVLCCSVTSWLASFGVIHVVPEAPSNTKCLKAVKAAE